MKLLRIELFDDEVERLSLFDPLTGEVLRSVPRFTVYPKTHYVTPRDTIINATDEINKELDEGLMILRVMKSSSRHSASVSV